MKTTETYNKEILTAIENKDPAKLQNVLGEMKTHGVGINDCMTTENYLEAAYGYRAQDEISVLLLDAGVDNHKLLSESNAPLYHLMDRGEVERVKLFVEHGADVNFACITEEYETHLEGKYDVDIRNNTATPIEAEHEDDYRHHYSIEKPFICAAIENYFDEEGNRIVKILLTAPNLDLLNYDEIHDNAFSYAVAYGDAALLKELATREPKIVTATNNHNLLNIAIHNLNLDTFKHLLTEHNVDPNEVSRVGTEDSLGKLLRRHNYLLENASEHVKEQDARELSTLGEMYKLLIAHDAKISAKTQKHYDRALALKSSFVSKINTGRENS